MQGADSQAPNGDMMLGWAGGQLYVQQQVKILPTAAGLQGQSGEKCNMRELDR